MLAPFLRMNYKIYIFFIIIIKANHICNSIIILSLCQFDFCIIIFPSLCIFFNNLLSVLLLINTISTLCSVSTCSSSSSRRFFVGTSMDGAFMAIHFLLPLTRTRLGLFQVSCKLLRHNIM